MGITEAADFFFAILLLADAGLTSRHFARARRSADAAILSDAGIFAMCRRVRDLLAIRGRTDIARTPRFCSV
jgi:hypothetical protein